jgi:hypothetical protein
MDLHEIAFELARHLNFEEIIEIEDLEGLKNQSYEETVLLLRQKLQETYPQTRLKRTIKSVHFANGFTDERLQRVNGTDCRAVYVFRQTVIAWCNGYDCYYFNDCTCNMGYDCFGKE